MTITYLTGDATQPIKTPALIMHVCNDIGGWGRGFVLALSKRWTKPEEVYRLHGAHRKHPLGAVMFVPVEDGIVVANMVAQHDVRRCDACGMPPVRYDALVRCLQTVGRYPEVMREENTPPVGWSIHAPRLGAGLAGGDWRVIEPLIEFYLKDREVYIYDLPETG